MPQGGKETYPKHTSSLTRHTQTHLCNEQTFCSPCQNHSVSTTDRPQQQCAALCRIKKPRQTAWSKREGLSSPPYSSNWRHGTHIKPKFRIVCGCSSNVPLFFRRINQSPDNVHHQRSQHKHQTKSNRPSDAVRMHPLRKIIRTPTLINGGDQT